MNNANINKMKNYKNWNDEQIGFAPFYQTAVKLFRISRRVNNKLEDVYEATGYKTRQECETACDEMFNKWNK